jgi:hypothetical protein
VNGERENRMNTYSSNLLAAAVVIVALATASGAATGFVPPTTTIAAPYTNQHCLENCHGVAGFGAGGADGRLRDLTVDAQAFVRSTHGQKGVGCLDCHQGADPNGHPRAGYPDVDCRACHSKTVPADVFPADALAKLAARGIQAPPEESRTAEGYNTTVHGKAWATGTPNAPSCPDCHSAHAIRKSEDPASPVHVANLPATCGRCHAEQVESGDVGGWLARLKISAHGKGDLSEKHAPSQCKSCHQGQAAHGEERLTGQACPTCHRVPEGQRETERTVVSSFHVKPHNASQPLARLLGWAYRVGFWAAAAGLALLVTVLGFAHLYRKPDAGEDAG